MKYMVMVSHGEMANGLKDTLFMLSGKKDEVISVGLMNGLSADEFAKVFESAIEKITTDDEIILLADIIGGSPLTTAMNVLQEKGLLAKTLVIGGMNLPLALTTSLMKDNMDAGTLAEVVLGEAHQALAEFKLTSGDEEEEDV